MSKNSFLYKMVVQVIPEVDLDDMDPDDQNEPILAEGGKVHYIARAEIEEIADDLVMDLFHGTTPISNLDDFIISTSIHKMSNHESLQALEKYPFLSNSDREQAYYLFQE